MFAKVIKAIPKCLTQPDDAIIEIVRSTNKSQLQHSDTTLDDTLIIKLTTPIQTQNIPQQTKRKMLLIKHNRATD